MPVSQGTRSVVAAFLTYRQHPLPPSCQDHGWQVFSFIRRTLHTVLTQVTKVDYWLADDFFF